MLYRRLFLAGLLTAFPTAVAARLAHAADPSTTDNPIGNGGGLPSSFDLKKQLETGLKARKPTDFAYIADVVTKVENGTIPRKLVDQAFLYARGRSKKYPLVYFQFSLKELSRKTGISL